MNSCTQNSVLTVTKTNTLRNIPHILEINVLIQLKYISDRAVKMDLIEWRELNDKVVNISTHSVFNYMLIFLVFESP